MKPGGRTHKGCEVPCLKGGVLYLLTNSSDGSLDTEFFDLAGDRVRFEGVREDWDDLPVLRLSAVPG